jgi:hypothetical protein
MALPISERDEIIVTNESVELLSELRTSLLANFPKTWVLLYNDSNEKIYGIEVMNDIGGRVSKDKDNSIREYIEKFMIERISS